MQFKNIDLLPYKIGAALTIFLFTASQTLAQFVGNTEQNISDLADNVRGSLDGIVRLVFAGCFVAGVVFVVIALKEFYASTKGRGENGRGIKMLFIGAAFIALGTIIGVATNTIFGGDADSTEAFLTE